MVAECLSLRVHNFNFDMRILTIHDGKGKKDRTVPIPDALMDAFIISMIQRCKKRYAGQRKKRKFPSG